MSVSLTSPAQVFPGVTREEIAHMERTLGFIDLKNSAIANVSRWLLIWESVRDLSNRYGLLADQSRAELADCFKELIDQVIETGAAILKLADQLRIDPEHFLLATGCDRESVGACVAFLENKIVQWFAPPISDDIISAVRDSLRDEPDPVV